MTKKEKEWEDFLKVIKMSVFLPQYAGIPYTPHTRHKMSGRSDRPNAEFTSEEWENINKGLEKLKKKFTGF